MAQFPGVDFSGVESDPDVLWTPERETPESILQRASDFLQWLRHRQERCIAVVSHDAFLFAVFNHLGKWPGVDISCYGDTRFRNCEVRRVEIPF